MSDDRHSRPRPPLREPGVMLGDLTDDLLWPRILRAPALALSPSRIITGTLAAFLLALLLQTVTLFQPAPDQQGTAVPGSGPYSEVVLVGERLGAITQSIRDSVLGVDPLALARSIGFAAVTIRDIVMQSPLIALLVGIPLIAILSLAGGAISRSTGIEFAQGRFASRDDTLGFTLRRARQFVGAVVIPIIFCALVFLVIALGGLLLSVPVLDVAGAVLYALALVLGIIATLVLMLHVLALPLIVPALALEGTDAFDAIQRSYAYVVGKPLRYLLYALILMVLGAVSATVFSMVAHTSIAMTDWAATHLSTDAGAAARVVHGHGELGATKGTAHWIVSLWRTLIEFVIAGYMISLFFTSSTLLYLVVRRVCDGQDITEIWEPGDA